jgi:Flp pilus assembly protein TadD
MIDIPLTGNIKNVSLTKILVSLNRNRKTGTLITKTPVFTKKVYLMKGDAIFASSTYEDDRLGEMLIKAGKITLEQYDESVELLKKTGKRQGAILVERGYLSPKDLFWGVKYQVREIIYSIFQFEDAEYELEEGEIPQQEVITLKMSMGNLIYEGVKRIDNWTRIKKEMPHADTVLKISSDPVSLFQDIELSQQDRKMLSIIDGTKTIKQLISSSWIGSFEATKILYVLWSMGVVKERGEEAERVIEAVEEAEEMLSLEEILQPVPEDEGSFIQKVEELYMRLDSMSDRELLEVDEGADEETLKKHYYRLTREFHPDRYFSSADPTMKDKLNAIFDAITDAYETLKDAAKKKKAPTKKAEAPTKKAEAPTKKAEAPTKKAEAPTKKKEVPAPVKEKPKEEVTTSQDAEKHFKQGVGAFKKKDFKTAIKSLKLATQLEPKQAKYWSYLSLFLAKFPDKLKDAEDALREAITLEPYNPEFYANLGMIYIKGGSKKKARNQFEKALKFDPENEKAKKGLKQAK